MMMTPGNIYKHKNARDIVFYCIAIRSDGTALGHYMNCHYKEIGARPDLFYCTDDIFTIDYKEGDWSFYESATDI